MAEVTRRAMLGGSAAAAALAGTVTAAVALAPSELDRLMAGYLAATRHVQEMEEIPQPDDNAEFTAALDAENEALWGLLNYRPQSLAEVQQRTDFMLASVPQLDDLNASDWMLLMMSTATKVGR